MAKSTNEKTLSELEDETLYDDDYPEVPPNDIIAYNELRSCADLVRMHAQGILTIQPEFQRDIVWTKPAQTRFIDSLIKQLPIPSMCFAMDYKQQKWMVIDGLQRMATIIQFLEGGDWKLSRLDDIDPALSGKSAAEFKSSVSSLHHFYTRVENLTIPITVLRCDFKKVPHMEYLFTIFHRLNTGAVKLNNQEIRNCIFAGAFNDLLKKLDGHSPWRRLNKMKPNQSYRFTKQELILRFFAFEEKYEDYRGYLAKFLNDYMHHHQNPNEQFLDEKKSLFLRTTNCFWEKILSKKSPGKLSMTFLEGALVGIARNITTLEELSPETVKARYNKLLETEDFSEVALKEGLSKQGRVVKRLNTAVDTFAGI